MHWYTVDYRKRDGAKPGTPFNRGFRLRLPRAMPECRIRGHKAVVDGTTGVRNDDPGSRWVCCDRCGTRPDPQGRLDPARWNIGDPYTGDHAPEPYPARAMGRQDWPQWIPGPWPADPTGVLGGQLVVGKTFGGAGISLEVGCAGSEHVLSGHVRLNPLGALYLTTEGHGTRLQRRLNPTGYNTKVVSVGIGDGRLRWRFGVDADAWSKTTPRRRDGSTVIDPRDRFLGPVRSKITKAGEPVTATVRMPHGDDHEVTLQLEHVATGRRRGKPKLTWSVDWTSENGIPTKPHGRGRIFGSGIELPAGSAVPATWPQRAAAAIAVQLTTWRERNDYVFAAPARPGAVTTSAATREGT
ncbi:hypothetical protein [Embleya sp. NPDC059237]|uniref:hypothetical protein n=1 Tax=Embleya sp. NPDC059237 TaxID=3346784 RepID=UPI0036D16F29